ncbi:MULTISPECIES: acyl-CoA thioesterase [Flavobacteriaceae]|uniref:Acyl-CoA thioesterase n=1 Tax=Flagellimonas marinaquae TaxID=254955 RepID=A0AA48HFX9_9FLAO|nr:MULTISPECIES: acyl-CoA thioesterase [Allomuricauda]MCA0960500.1 acyl-CoA thioesterase [Allomuricauda ruestringensis]USD25636.1 acyl-CoA thioesterase [Allomuricauda aquimarina]BDW91498.1 acyl-CoA thioesterase [Allomuricauda aquimarina]
MKKFKSSRESRVSITELMLPSHSNFGGKVHGGHILNLMDQIAFACASKHSQSYCVTASVNRVDFLNPIEVGELATLKASINYTGKTSMVVGVRVESENVTTGEVKHCNSSYFTMVAKGKDGKNKAVPGLILKTKQDIRRFARSKERKQSAYKRDSKYESNNFKVNEYLEFLEGENVKMDLD